MTFALRFKAHYAAAKTQYFAEQTVLQVKAEQLLAVVGAKQPPVTLEGLKDGFDRAVELGMPRAEADRLQTVLARSGFERLVNDETRYVARFSRTAEQMKELIGDLEKPGTFEQIKSLIPEELRAKLTPEQIDLVASEVQHYAVEVCEYIRAAVLKGLHSSQTVAQRTVGFAQMQAASDAFSAMGETLSSPLKSFTP